MIRDKERQEKVRRLTSVGGSARIEGICALIEDISPHFYSSCWCLSRVGAPPPSSCLGSRHAIALPRPPIEASQIVVSGRRELRAKDYRAASNQLCRHEKVHGVLLLRLGVHRRVGSGTSSATRIDTSITLRLALL